MEKIMCSAIWIRDNIEHVHQPINVGTGYVSCGFRHPNCYGILAANDPDWKYRQFDEVQGFLTNRNRFVNREEAYIIAKEANQLINDFEDKYYLCSEDLW